MKDVQEEVKEEVKETAQEQATAASPLADFGGSSPGAPTFVAASGDDVPADVPAHVLRLPMCHGCASWRLLPLPEVTTESWSQDEDG